MKYLAFVGTDGPQPEEARAQMARDFPAYSREMDARGLWRIGRPLDIDEPAATVRNRNGEVLVSDGPFAETKEFVGGLDVFDCADRAEAIEVEGKSPVARFLPFEVRPFTAGALLGAGLDAFGRGDDGAGIPHLLTVWVAGAPAPLDDAAAMRDYDAWQQTLEARGTYVLGGGLGGPATAATLRYRDGQTQVSDGSFLDLDEFIAGVDIVSCGDRQQAIALAATHPFARSHAIEVRPFASE